MGLQMPLTNCCKTAPTAVSDASVTMHVGGKKGVFINGEKILYTRELVLLREGRVIFQPSLVINIQVTCLYGG